MTEHEGKVCDDFGDLGDEVETQADMDHIFGVACLAIARYVRRTPGHVTAFEIIAKIREVTNAMEIVLRD